MPMEKISNKEAAQLNKLAAQSLRALSEENTGLRKSNDDLKTKLASFEKKAHAETIADLMEEKGINPELSFQEKVAQIMEQDDLTVLEKAVGMSAPHMKLASVHDDAVEVEDPSGSPATSAAEDNFARALVSSADE